MSSGFCIHKKQYDFWMLIKLSQTDPDFDDPNNLFINKEVTAMQQAVEWGMPSMQSSFLHLKDCIIYEEIQERKVIMKMIILLYNLRA